MQPTNPYPEATDSTRVMANIGTKEFDYFFRRVFTGDRGPRQAMINLFFKAAYDAAVAEGIPAQWSIENQTSVTNLLNRLNFNGPQPAESRPRKSTLPRRTASPTPKPKV